jgi:hypothetical protein
VELTQLNAPVHLVHVVPHALLSPVESTQAPPQQVLPLLSLQALPVFMGFSDPHVCVPELQVHVPPKHLVVLETHEPPASH